MLHRKSNNLTPTALYALYENQAKELNRITQRLMRVIEAIKARGAYNGEFGDELERIMDEDDNALIPTDKSAGMTTDGGFDKNIWFLPIGEMVGVAQQLYMARESCKQVIYEITGISDIVRGASKASETLGAQKMKEAWGTMRLKNMQSDVQQYVRELLRIMLDVAVNNLSQRLWIKITGLPYPTAEQKEKALELMNEIKPKIQMAYAQQQEPDKKLLKEAEELTKMLAQPSWEDILETLGDDYIRSFKVDIETNSTLDVEATEDKKNIAEFMNAMAQFMNGLMPMVKEGTLPWGAAKSWLLDIAKRYRFGEEVEDEIKAMEEPKRFDHEQAKKKIQEEQKKLQDAGKKLAQEKQKFEEEQKKVGDAIDQQVNDLARDKMQFDFDKKMHDAKVRMEQKLAEQKLALKDQLNQAADEIDRAKAESQLQKMVDKHARNVQGMMDKHLDNIKKMTEAQVQQPPRPAGKQNITMIYDEDGVAKGAEVIDEYGQKKMVALIFDEDGNACLLYTSDAADEVVPV